ncbi:Disease resistance protein L6 [Linum perenne]
MDYQSPKSASSSTNKSRSFSSDYSSNCEPKPLPPGEYEVFLSFRGPDVRTNFVDYLYSRLIGSRIRTFRDEEGLPKGEVIASSLVEAITESKIYIPVFSGKYAESKWCLQELAKMVECWKRGKGHIILPIFYFVNPRDVRSQTGPYEEAFELHSQKHDADTVKEWRKALKQVGQMKGWTVNESDGQGAIVDMVFSRVDRLLMMNYKLVSDQDFVGVDFHVEKVMKLLDFDSQSVKLLSIHGIGGIGKTTLAKAVYDKVYTKFDGCCFLEDVWDTLTKSEGALSLQNKIISTILRRDVQIQDTSIGTHVIKDRICKHKVLIVLDNVGEAFEFDKILGKIGNFSLGSRFMITTRDNVLNFCTEYNSYELGEMNREYSLQLFSKHAFKMDYPPKDYVTLSHKFVEAAAGLPLALKVIGSLLFRKDEIIWEEKLMQLKDVPPTDVQKRLKISYDALTYEEQQIFLDIACFFIGEKKKLPIYMWSACKFYPEDGIATLILRSLIKVNENDQFCMHNHIRDLGRAIVRDENVEDPGKRSRIWSTDDALDMLKSKQGTVKVRALSVHLDCELTEKEFNNLSKLRYLEVKGGRLMGDFTEILRDIRWLRLSSCTSIPTRFQMNKLVTLELENIEVGDDWQVWNEIKMANKLKVITLLDCGEVRKTPDLSRCGALELIHFELCLNMSGRLDIGNLKRLKELRVMECQVTKLTGNVAMLTNLQVINFFAFGGVTRPLPKLPRSVKQLSIAAAVPNLSELKDLQELHFKSCSDGLRIAADVSKLSNLKILTVLLAEDAGNGIMPPLLPSSLICLRVHGDDLLQRLPSLANLNNLTELSLRCIGVPEVHGLGAMTLLKTLHISVAPNLSNLDGLENLLLLTELTLSDCCELKRLPSLATLTKLCCMVISDCPSIADLEGLGCLKLAKMKTLILKGNPRFRELRSIWHLSSLLNLDISRCDSLKRLLNLSRLKNLKSIRVDSCKGLTELTGLEGLESLEVLEVTSCVSVNKLSNLSTLKKLKQLKIEYCSELSEVTGLEGLESLEELELEGFSLMRKLPGLSNLKKLKSFMILGFTELTEISGLGRLKSLEEIYISDCTSMKRLSDLSSLTKLKRLKISRTKLRGVKGVEGLESLEKIILVDCESIKKSPDLRNLKNLRLVNVPGTYMNLLDTKNLETISNSDT